VIADKPGKERCLNRSYDEYRENMGIFSVKHKISRTNEKSTFHIHAEFELLLNLSEDICCRVGNSAYHLKKNTLLIFNNMDLHHISIMKPGGVSNRDV
jgi:hypothetical protein